VRRLLGVAALLATLAGATAGCSIPTQGDPSSIPASKVPFNLLDPHPSTTTTTQPKAYVSRQVFFINSSTQELQAEPRYVAPPASLTSIITAMLQGPAESETDVGTAIPSDVSVLSTNSLPGNIVVVNMNGAFAQITGVELERAVAQIVATVAAADGAGTGVVFDVDGQRTAVPIANGSVNGPVYLIQFLGPLVPAA
jgi:spore germination protein GerM